MWEKRQYRFFMAGPEGVDDQYLVILSTNRGRVSIKGIPSFGYRVLVEPRLLFGKIPVARRLYRELTPQKGWNQPGIDDHPWFSRVAVSLEELRSTLRAAFISLTEGVKRVHVNPDLDQVPAEGVSEAQRTVDWAFGRTEKEPDMFFAPLDKKSRLSLFTLNIFEGDEDREEWPFWGEEES